MSTRTATLIVLATAAVLGAGFLVVLGIGRGLQALRRSASHEAARMEFVARWRPPQSLDAQRAFPESVQGRTPAARETNPKLADPALELPGWFARYEAPGFVPIEVFVCQPRPLEAEALRERARRTFDQRPGNRTVSLINNRLRLTSSQPPQTVEIWEMPGWLFFFRSSADIPTDFIRDYLTAVATPPAPSTSTAPSSPPPATPTP